MEPTTASVGVSIFIEVVAAILTVAVTGLFGWVYNINSRVVTLEAERVNLGNLEKLMTTRYEALEKLIDAKFDHLHTLLAATQPIGRIVRAPKDERD